MKPLQKKVYIFACVNIAVPRRRIVKKFVLITATVFIISTGAAAEELIGVPIYPGAVLDRAATDYMDDVLYLDGAAYRTTDSAAAVAEFYEKKGFVRINDSSKDRIRFKKDEIEVTIQGPPRKDHVTKKIVHDTLITLVRQD